MATKIAVLIVFLAFTLSAFAQTAANPGMDKIEKDKDGRPEQTDKILLKDGSEKKHRAPKNLKKESNDTLPSDSEKSPSNKNLPTDVD